MSKSKLIGLLSVFSKAEIKSFGQFVASPFFNKNQLLINLLDEITKFHPSFDSKRYDEKLIFQRLFPTSDFNKPQLTKLQSKLFKLAEQFIKYQEFNKDQLKGSIHLLEYYKHPDLRSYFTNTISLIEKKK